MILIQLFSFNVKSMVSAHTRWDENKVNTVWDEAIKDQRSNVTDSCSEEIHSFNHLKLFALLKMFFFYLQQKIKWF